MWILPLQWERGTTNSIGERKLVFSADKSVDLGDFNPFKIEQGTQFIVMFIEADSQEAINFRNETKEETIERFRRHMNSLINSVANLKKEDPKKYREDFKTELKREGLIKSSTLELNLQGYALVITKLKQIKNGIENRTNKS